jgi:Spy/CpxP family protein refolding chaperone
MKMKNSTNKFLTIAVIILLLANIALVAFLVMGKNKKSQSGHGKSPIDKMVNELGMDEVQKKQFDSLRSAHFATIRPLFDSIRATRQSLFNLIREENLDDSLVTDYSGKIAERQMMADKLTVNHFRQIRKMFIGENLKKFDEMVQKMLQRGKRDSANKKEK